MADIKIFISIEDFWNIIDFLIDKFAVEIFPETCFDEPLIKGFTSKVEIEKHIDAIPDTYSMSYFITSPHWKVEPIYYNEIDKSGMKVYYIRQRYGGPAFHFIPSFSFPRIPKEKKILGGIISDYSGYYSLKDDDYKKTFERPEAMKNALSEIKKYITKNSRKVVFKGKTNKSARLMSNAGVLVDSGIELYEGSLKYE